MFGIFFQYLSRIIFHMDLCIDVDRFWIKTAPTINPWGTNFNQKADFELPGVRPERLPEPTLHPTTPQNHPSIDSLLILVRFWTDLGWISNGCQ